MTATPPPRVDGRTARSERTRTAIVDAHLQLIREGDLRPTAEKIAKQAGVSLRRAINPKLVEAPAKGFPKSNPGMYSDPQSLNRGLKEMDLESSWG